ncbi:unnamed protein product [Choristocarpus tenellus]
MVFPTNHGSEAMSGMDLDSYTSQYADIYDARGDEGAYYMEPGAMDGMVQPNETQLDMEPQKKEGEINPSFTTNLDSEDSGAVQESFNDVVSRGREGMPQEATLEMRDEVGTIRTTDGIEGDMKEEDDMIPGVDDLPIFANDQSKALNAETKSLEKKVDLAQGALMENKERVHVMEEHLKNVRQEVGHTNALLDAKKKQIETEEHLLAIAIREARRYGQEGKTFIVSTEEAQEKLNAVQNSMFSVNERMDGFKLQMNWNQEELEQWALAAKQKEDDNLALQKYTRADEVKIKALR